MALFDINHPAVVTLRSELTERVENYRANFALRDSTKVKPTTFSKAITLPLDAEESDAIEGLSEFIAEQANVDLDDDRKAIFFSHIANQLDQASKFFKSLAEDWATPSLQVDESDRLSDAQLKELSKECYNLFQTIIEWTGDPEATGQAYKPRANDKGFLLDIPRIKETSTKASATSASERVLYVNDVLMNQTNDAPYMNHALREAFGTQFKPSEILEMMKEQGIKMTTNGQNLFTMPNGKEYVVEFTNKA